MPPSVSKGQTVSIPDETPRVRFELGWGASFTDVDAICIGLTTAGEQVLVLGPGRRAAHCKGLIVGRYGGDKWTGIGSGERTTVNLQMMSPTITSLYFVAAVVAESKSIATVASGLHCALVSMPDKGSNYTIAESDPIVAQLGGGADLQGVNGVVLYALRRDLSSAATADTWSLEVPMVPCPHRTADALMPLLAQMTAEYHATVRPIPHDYAATLEAREAKHNALVKDFTCCAVM